MKTYARPAVTEYGRMDRLTLGQHSNLPDYNVNGGVIANDNCDPTNSGPGSSGNSNPFQCIVGGSTP